MRALTRISSRRSHGRLFCSKLSTMNALIRISRQRSQAALGCCSGAPLGCSGAPLGCCSGLLLWAAALGCCSGAPLGLLGAPLGSRAALGSSGAAGAPLGLLWAFGCLLWGCSALGPSGLLWGCSALGPPGLLWGCSSPCGILRRRDSRCVVSERHRAGVLGLGCPMHGELARPASPHEVGEGALTAVCPPAGPNLPAAQ